jgi:uncharacterized membrane protein YdjX (TVP38/TMEM64 family)
LVALLGKETRLAADNERPGHPHREVDASLSRPSDAQDRLPPRLAFRATVLAVALCCLLIAIYIAWLVAEARGVGLAAALSSVGPLEEIIASWGSWGPAASIALMIAHSFIPFPAELLAIANGMLFGITLGTLLTWTGAMLGALSAFALARWFGQELVRPLLGERRWHRMQGWIARGGASGLIVARLIPVISFNLINYAAGLAGVGWWTFTWTTALGILPITFASVLVGSHMVEAPAWAWGLLAVAVIALWLAHRHRAKEQGGIHGEG